MSTDVLLPPTSESGTNSTSPPQGGQSTSTTAGPALDLNKRVFSLDVLRGIAILLVLPSHSILPAGDIGWMKHINREFENFGWTGVDLFFVLSGFLIGGLLFREIKKTGRLNARRFLTRRALKLWPAYFALLAWATLKATRHDQFSFSQLWPSLLQVQNYFQLFRPHTWSLAVEEHFYISLAIVLGLFTIRSKGVLETKFEPLAIFAIGLLALWRSIQPYFVPWNPMNGYFATHIRIDALLFGVLLAHIATFRHDIWNRLLCHPKKLIAVGLVCVSPPLFVARELHWIHTAGYTFLYFGYGCILVGAVGLQTQSKRAPKNFRKRVLSSALTLIAWIGVYSYSIYLWHIDFAQQPVWFHLQPHLAAFGAPTQWALSMIIYLVVAILVGFLMTCIIEIPVLHFRERFFPRPVDAPVPAPTPKGAT